MFLNIFITHNSQYFKILPFTVRIYYVPVNTHTNIGLFFLCNEIKMKDLCYNYVMLKCSANNIQIVMTRWIRHEQSPYHLPESKCKKSQREKLDIHVQKKILEKHIQKKADSIWIRRLWSLPYLCHCMTVMSLNWSILPKWTL